MANIKRIPAIDRLKAMFNPIIDQINKKVTNKKADNTPLEAGKHYGVKGDTGELEEIQIPKAVPLATQFNNLSATEKDLVKHSLGMPVPDHTITSGAPETLEHYVQVVKQGGKVKYNFHAEMHVVVKGLTTEDTTIFSYHGKQMNFGAFAKFGGVSMLCLLNGYKFKAADGSYILRTSGSSGTTLVPFSYDGHTIPAGTVIGIKKGSHEDSSTGMYVYSIILTIPDFDSVGQVDKSYWLYADGKWYDAETGGTEITPTFSLPATLDTNHSLNIHYA